MSPVGWRVCFPSARIWRAWSGPVARSLRRWRWGAEEVVDRIGGGLFERAVGLNIALVTRTRQQLLEFFEEQLGFLELSNEAFDAGMLAEAKRLAGVLRTLFHHTADSPRGSSHALINQLDLQDTLTWVATAGTPNPNNLGTTWGLVQVGMDIGEGRPLYRAPLGDRPPARIRTTVGNVPRGSRDSTSMRGGRIQ